MGSDWCTRWHSGYELQDYCQSIRIERLHEEIEVILHSRSARNEIVCCPWGGTFPTSYSLHVIYLLLCIFILISRIVLLLPSTVFFALELWWYAHVLSHVIKQNVNDRSSRYLFFSCVQMSTHCWTFCFVEWYGTHIEGTHRIPSFFMFSIVDFEQSMEQSINGHHLLTS